MRFLRRGGQADEQLPTELEDGSGGDDADEAGGVGGGGRDDPGGENGAAADLGGASAREPAGESPGDDTVVLEPVAEPDAEGLAGLVTAGEFPGGIPAREPAHESDADGLAGLVAATPHEAPAREPSVAPASARRGTAGSRAEPAEPRRPTRARKPRPTAEPQLDLGPDTGPDPLAEGRPAALRMAALHLRAGQHALARAELEALAGAGRLDEAALLDLAEVRWRTGDLPGAGDAANALLARGGESPLALVIAAEAVAAAGRPGEARRLSDRALQVAAGPLDSLFAGMPRAMIWPVAAAPEVAPAPTGHRRRRAAREADGAPSTAAEAFAGGRAALARGDASRAALLLGVAMRLEPGFADDVLRAVASRDDQPMLALVRGDALRLLGRETEALEAFDRARGRSSAAVAGTRADAGPGLFDDDPSIADDDAG